MDNRCACLVWGLGVWRRGGGSRGINGMDPDFSWDGDLTI